MKGSERLKIRIWVFHFTYQSSVDHLQLLQPEEIPIWHMFCSDGDEEMMGNIPLDLMFITHWQFGNNDSTHVCVYLCV